MTETTEQTRKCSNCMWWVSGIEGIAIFAPNGSPLGICRGAAPSPSWPSTTADDWCGSFRMKEPGQ